MVKSGIFVGVILVIGRVFGEVLVVFLVVGGLGLGFNFDIFGRINIILSRILLGFKEVFEGLFDFEIRFIMGFVLIIVILFFNILLNVIKKRVVNYEF